MTITWQPWQKVILEPGDIYAPHGGSKGILKIGPLQFNLGSAAEPIPAVEPSVEDPYLLPWVRWLNETDWDGLWNEHPE